MLSEEHKNILAVISAIDKECSAIQSGKNIDRKFFIEAIDFIRNYADKFHHAKDEDILFKEMCKDTVHLHCNPIEQMLYEHDLGRNFVKAMENALNSDNPKLLVDNALGYAQLLQEHIWKEDNVLYPMAEDALPDESKKYLLEKFKEIAETKLKKETIQRYLAIAKQFKNRE